MADAARKVPSGTLLARDIRLLVTMNKQGEEICDAAIFVNSNEITWVGATADIPVEYSKADTIVSLPDRVVMPGLVNSHHHMFQSLLKCVAQEDLLFGWLKTLYKGFAELTGQDVYTAAKTAMTELIMSGCTTTSDHLYVYPNDVKLDDTIKAAREIGIRFHPTRGAMSLGESSGGLPPDSVCEEEPAVLLEMERLIEDFHDNSKFSMLRIGLAPCSPFTVTNDLMIAAAKLARKHEGVRLHTHLAENQEDVDYSLQTYGCRPGEYLRQVGWDKDDCWFAHCCMLDAAERQQFSKCGLGIAHCPASNLRLGSGIAPVKRLLADGVNVGISVDGSASNDAGNLLAEARLACFLQRAGGNAAAMTARETLHCAIKGGAKNLGRDDIGELSAGFAADFVGFRTDKPAFAGAQHDLVCALIFCSPGADQVDLSVINGEVVVQDGKLLTLDVPALIKEHNERSARICSFL